MDEIVKELKESISRLAERDDTNFIDGQTNIYDEPIVGVTNTDDPLFKKFKEDENIIGDVFCMPDEWLPGAKSVISYFLPFSEKVRSSNYSDGACSMEWLHARFQGEEFNQNVRRLIIEEIKIRGGEAVGPLLEDKFFKDFEVYTSNWSERHVAYIAGLGTFSHSRSLITAKGTAGRFGSVITDLELIPTKREYDDPFSYCLYTTEGKCGKCIDRCPAGAISKETKDKSICAKHLLETDLTKKEREEFGYPYSPCGKCQTKVPCESGIPK